VDTALVVGAGLLGLVVGAALDGPIERLPMDGGRDALFAPRCSHCGQAHSRLLVPVVRPACPGCGRRPPVRTVAVQALTALLFAGMAYRIGAQLALVPFVFLAAVVVVVTFIDIDHLRIPDRVTFPALGVSTVLIVVTSLVKGHPQWIVGALLGAVAFFAILLVFHLVSPAGMGFGDVKLGLLLGLNLGWISLRLVVWGLLIGALLGSVIGVAVGIARRSRKAAFPFGPALGMGAMVAVVLAPRLLG